MLQEAQTRAQQLRIQLGEIEEKAREAFEDLVDDKRSVRDAELRVKMASTRFKGAQREVLRLEEEKRVEERNPRKARVSHEFLSGWLKAIATHSLSFRLFGFLLIEMNILTAEAIFLPTLLYTN